MQTFTLPKTLTLDYTKWRCGSRGEHKHGNGPTRLLNEDGYMCCLGQFMAQAGCPATVLLGYGAPATVVDVSRVRVPELLPEKDDDFAGCSLTNRALNINDNKFLTTPERVKQLL